VGLSVRQAQATSEAAEPVSLQAAT
jgi:hypothetical protein